MPEIPQRMVCLCPSLTETLFYLGAGERVVGVTDWCVHPAKAVATKTKVGGTKNPNLERLFALHPDLVIVNEEENRIEDVQQIQAHGIGIFNTFPRTVDGAMQTMREMGQRIGCAQAGQALAKDISAVKHRLVLQTKDKPAVRYACLIWKRPLMTINQDTFIHDLLHLAGGENVFADLPARYPEISLQQIIVQDPDIILLPSEPFVFKERHRAQLSEELQWPWERFMLVDGQFISWYGSRLLQGIDYAGKILAQARHIKSKETH